MPELSEIHLFAQLINTSCSGKTFFGRTHSSWNKHPQIELPWSEFKISAVARGKELQLYFEPARDAGSSSNRITYTFTHGLVGKWEWVTASSLPSAPAGTQIMFHSGTHSLIYNDAMKMGGWRKESWGKSRGPDPMLEFWAFCSAVVGFAKKKPDTLMCDLLLEQSCCNGIGNYLRAEVLYRAGLDPFVKAGDIFGTTSQTLNASHFSSIYAETASGLPNIAKHDPALMVLYLCRQIPLEVITADMNKYGTTDQKERFKKWLRIYDKGTPVKHTGRAVHCSPQQRLGKLSPDLGKMITEYPFAVNEYNKPTLIVGNSSSSASPSPSASTLNVPSPVGGATFSTKKQQDEVHLTCEQIMELVVPMSTKLLLAVASLDRSGKLGFLDVCKVKTSILVDHPVAYSAWQVYEANLDEDDLVDTLKRLGKFSDTFSFNPDPLAKALGDLTLSKTNSNTIRQQQMQNIQQQQQQQQQKKAEVFELPPRSAPAKKVKRHESSSESFSESSSTTGDGSISEGEEERPTKKKKKSKKAVPQAKLKTNKFKPLELTKKTNYFANLPVSSTTSSASVLTYLTEKSWLQHLQPCMGLTRTTSLFQFVEEAYSSGKAPVYPAKADIWNAFNLCPLDKVRVVILGQDPYHGAGQAHGLCFSVLKPTPPPPSLVNIYKELASDIPGFTAPDHGDLTAWAKQGVFLLNAVLTVHEKSPNSHANRGWEGITSAAINTLNNQRKGIVFMLWGAAAQKTADKINKQVHHVLLAPHPSPLSAFNGWFGSKHFSQANALLSKQGDSPIDWTLP